MFRTELPLTPHPQQLPLSARVLTMGSCFSDTIGSRLTDFKVSTLVNPFGTVFNPIVACQLLRAAAGEDMDWQQHLVEARGRWQSYDLHASMGAASPVALLQQIQEVVQRTGAFLAQADVVMLTLGTAFTYRLKETQELVNNCHKLPAERFEKEMLTPDEIINAVAETHAYLRRKNPKLRFVLTVSPVRHLKDTLLLNSVSKSVLRVACHYLSELLPDISYFPAYELLLDDLRDYRFYASDMLHPSDVAEDYIWEKFSRTYFDANFGRFKKEWEAVRQALAHRPLFDGSPEHRHFLENTLERLHRLSSQVDLRAEIRQLHKQIVQLPPPPKIQPIVVPEVEDDEERIDVGGEAESAKEVRAEEVSQPAPESAINPEPIAAVEATPEAPIRKKRRTRGGAKRNKNKKAAQLAAQATATDAVITETPTPVAEIPEVEPAIHPALPPAVAKAAAMHEASKQASAQEAMPEVLDVPAPLIPQAAPSESAEVPAKRPARRTASQVRASANRKPRRPAKAAPKSEQPVEAATPVPNAPPVVEVPVAVAPVPTPPAPEPAIPVAAEVPAKPKARRPARRVTPAKEKKALPPPPKAKAAAAPSPLPADASEATTPKRRGRPPRKKPVTPDEAPQNS